ncbi:hypothetical protein B0T24DRAFT_289018 [Lasiosphaeria ovina]|uniref:DUF676 domain-containing protein n=1 Tax=Lasiosphaeria ovina TaxID=92902 RepID=A0AAE0KDF6_9PEZI|nr:hypothetical protein B0T24DRAFT_289018 [Lasiosphaeria ovina]
MATSFGLETVLVPTGTDPDQFIDVVALHGIAGLGRESWLYAGDGELKYKKWFEDQYPNIRFSVYDYPFLDSQANVFVRGGIRREALRLLEALTALRAAGEEKKRRIMFFGHDVGGVIVKEALIMSAFGDVRFRDIYLSTRRIVS